jgi:2-aminoethylphosphonate transport system substrate-binding protein
MKRHARSLAIAAAGLCVASLSACGVGTAGPGGGGGGDGSKVVTMYSADGLNTSLGAGQQSWFAKEFAAFTKETGIKVNYVEGGSGDVMNRVEMQKTNQQADILMTLPPFIQEAADDGLLANVNLPNMAAVPAADKAPDGTWTTLVDNDLAFLYNDKLVKEPPATFQDLLNPHYKGELQYSTPGQAGDGTAFMIAAMHAFGGDNAKAFAYLKQLQANNLGPSSSTGALTTKLIQGDLAVANGDLQMNGLIVQQNPNVHIWFPRGQDGTPFTLSLPYAMGLVKGAPHADNGKKLMNFLLSKAAQQDVSGLSFGLPARSDVHPTDKNYQTLQAALQGVTVWHPDYAAIAKDISALVQQYHQAIGS